METYPLASCGPVSQYTIRGAGWAGGAGLGKIAATGDKVGGKMERPQNNQEEAWFPTH